MKQEQRLRAILSTVALAAAALLPAPAEGYSETPGMERRDAARDIKKND